MQETGCTEKEGSDRSEENSFRRETRRKDISTKKIDRKELDLKTDEGEISKYNVQLNSIKTNKEYTALCSEIGSKKADMSILEDVILNTMSRLEIVNKEYSELTENLKREEESLKELIKSVDADVRETDIEIEKVQNDQKNI